MEGAEYEEFKADIAANGLRESIWLHPDGSIIDGRNRHRACIETGVSPRFCTWNGEGSLTAFVVSMNLHRRHLTSSQRGMLAADIEPALAKERAAGRPSSKANSATNCAIFGEARDDAAQLMQTNRQYVSDAKTLKREAPDLAEHVRIGEKPIPHAKRELVKRQRQEAPPLPSDKYRILYADPPWKYGNAGIIGETDHYGHVERHYPAMSIEELCAMGEEIKAVTEPDAVLFLWVTSPMLEDSFRLIKAWGFKYKTSMIWDKVKHNFGYYCSVRHELLLICTRGSCTPDGTKLYDSVQSIPRSDKHSEKPAFFREMIDELYPHGKRLELFAREWVEGWEIWGNEPR